jgi:DNA-binding transcriptional regulator YdaS (Cro superfamily)
MTYDEMIRKYGTQVAAAEALATSQSTVSRWSTTGRIPLRWQLTIEKCSDGELITDRELLPPFRARRRRAQATA